MLLLLKETHFSLTGVLLRFLLILIIEEDAYDDFIRKEPEATRRMERKRNCGKPGFLRSKK